MPDMLPLALHATHLYRKGTRRAMPRMPKIALFISQSCPKCPKAKEDAEALKAEGYRVVVYDIGTVDGLTEASYLGVQSSPTFIVLDKEENVMYDSRGGDYSIESVKRAMDACSTGNKADKEAD